MKSQNLKLTLKKTTISKLNNQQVKFLACKSAAGCDSVGGDFFATCDTHF